MPRTPDRRDGRLFEDEELVLGETSIDPTTIGAIRRVGNDLKAQDGIGVFNLRQGGGGGLLVQNIPFTNLSVVLVVHNRHYFPLVQVVTSEYAAWNLGGWSLAPWNGGLSEFARLPDDQYVTTHVSEDAFWLEFSTPLTGEVVYC